MLITRVVLSSGAEWRTFELAVVFVHRVSELCVCSLLGGGGGRFMRLRELGGFVGVLLGGGRHRILVCSHKLRKPLLITLLGLG